jgi:hypothetical protein
MAVKTKTPLEKIMALKKRLHNLPPKDTGKTREEAMAILAPVFQSALSKGYSLKELRGMITEEGVTLALSGLAEKKPKETEAETRENADSDTSPPAALEAPEELKTPKLPGNENARESREEAPEIVKEHDAPEEQKPPEQKTAVQKIAAEAMKKLMKTDEKPAHGFKVRPDTPDTEL